MRDLSKVKIGEVFDVCVVHEGETDRYQGAPSRTKEFTAECHAVAAAYGAGWYGGPATYKKYKAIKATDKNFYLVTQDIDKIDSVVTPDETRLRRNALAKLSPEEIKILGLNKNG